MRILLAPLDIRSCLVVDIILLPDGCRLFVVAGQAVCDFPCLVLVLRHLVLILYIYVIISCFPSSYFSTSFPFLIRLLPLVITDQYPFPLNVDTPPNPFPPLQHLPLPPATYNMNLLIRSPYPAHQTPVEKYPLSKTRASKKPPPKDFPSK